MLPTPRPNQLHQRRKVQWICDDIGTPHEGEDWGTGFRSTRESEFLAMKSNALAPVIKDGDFEPNGGSVGGGVRTVVPVLLHFDFMQPRCLWSRILAAISAQQSTCGRGQHESNGSGHPDGVFVGPGTEPCHRRAAGQAGRRKGGE